MLFYSSILLGVLTGLDPSKGWLYSVYFLIHRGSRKTMLNSFLIVIFSHFISIIISSLPFIIAYALFSSNVIFFSLSLTVLIHGVTKFLLPNLHYKGSVKPSYSQLMKWSLINSTISFYGPFIYLCYLVSPFNLISYISSLLLTMSFTIIYFSLKGLNALRKVWFNYDRFIAIIFITSSIYQITSFCCPYVHIPFK
jgi:hypothetical protein